MKHSGDPEYEAASFAIGDGPWTTVVHKKVNGHIVETRVIQEGMSEQTMEEVDKIANNNPEAAFRKGTPR